VTTSRLLTNRERKALERLSLDRSEFLIKEKFPRGVAAGTLDGLVEIGLAERGPSTRYPGLEGYRIAPDGWRAMYGKTYAEIMQDGTPVHPLRAMRWPLDGEA